LEQSALSPVKAGHFMNTVLIGDPLTQAAQLLRRSNVTEGKPFPLGATWDGLGVDLAAHSEFGGFYQHLESNPPRSKDVRCEQSSASTQRRN
jgi:hypothetical protein